MTEVNESAITFSHQRDADGKVAITAVLFGGQAFKRSIWIQEAEERARFLNDLVADYPGIASERKIIRAELQKIARATEIDLRFNTCGQINGRASCSARLWSGSRVIETASLNLLAAESRSRAIKHLVPYVAGRSPSKRKLSDAEKRLHRLFMAELQRVLSMPAQQPHTFDPLRAAEEVPYQLVDGVGILWQKKLLGGGMMPTLLTNFTAKITATVWRTDGVDRTCEYELEAMMRGKSPRRFIVKQSEFEEMSWPVRELGAEAAIEPENGYEKRARTAIQKLSTRSCRSAVHPHRMDEDRGSRATSTSTPAASFRRGRRRRRSRWRWTPASLTTCCRRRRPMSTGCAPRPREPRMLSWRRRTSSIRCTA
jgi:hypothetical protein